MRNRIHQSASRTAGVLHPEWLPCLPTVVFAGEMNAADPLMIRAAGGKLLVAAESRNGGSSAVLVSSSADDGTTWERPRQVYASAAGRRVTAGAGGATPQGKLVLALHEWRDTPGSVAWVREGPRGVHHYEWSGFRRTSSLHVLLSDDEGKTWAPAACDKAAGPIAPSAMGRVFAQEGSLWLAVYGPADGAEMDAALGSVGLLRSDDGGASWRFSHWVARADREDGIGYGPGEIIVLPDGRWLGLLQGDYRGLGDYTRPRLCRAVSSDGGRSWSEPEQKLLNHGCSTVLLGEDEIMVGGWKKRGIVFSIGTNAGADWLCQQHVWACIWYQSGDRGGVRLLERDDGVWVVYHWMDQADPSRTEVRVQAVRRRAGQQPPRRSRGGRSEKRHWKWVMAQARQVPDMDDAPSGLRLRTLLKLQSGDWTCIGMTGTARTAGASYGFGASGLCVMRSPGVEGPWHKIVDLPIPEEAGSVHDPGTGTGMPAFLAQHSSGRLFLPFSSKDRKDIILTFSDDEGLTWGSLGSAVSLTGLPDVREADMLVEQKDGSLVFPMVTGAGWEPGVVAHPFYIRSADGGRTWSDPVFWATHTGAHYEGLPYGRAGDLRETALAVLDEDQWLGVYRESRGTPAPVDDRYGPCDMPYLCLSRSADGGRTWEPSFGFLGLEPALAVTPDGAVFLAYRDDCLASVWISYDGGRTWQIQEDPAEVPWHTAAAEAHGQWPPGGESSVRVLDEETLVMITDTGLMPSGKPLPAGFKRSRELHGRAQVRFFRRVRATDTCASR